MTEPVLLLTESVVFINEVIPATFNTLPMYNDLAIESPPRVVIEPVEIDTESVVLVIESVVNLPVFAVVLPIADGIANVLPLSNDEFKFGILVVLAIENGAVPVVTLLVITPVTFNVLPI